MSQTSLIGASLLALSVSFLLALRRRKKDRFPVVPGSWCSGVLPELGVGFRDVIEKLDEWALSYGQQGFFELFLGTERVVVCYSWAEAQQVLALRPFKVQNSARCKHILRGLAFSEGAQWQKERRLIAPVFNAKNMQSYVPAVEQVTSKLLGELRREMRLKGEADFGQLLAFFGADVFAMTSLGGDIRALECREVQLLKDVKAVSKAIRRRITARLPYWKVPGLGRWDGVQKASERLQQTLEEIMGTERASETIAWKLKALAEGETFSRKELLDNLTTLFLRGADTSKVLCWAFYHLAIDEVLQEQVFKEVKELPEGHLSFAHLASLLWLQAVWLESLRCHGPSGYMPLETLEALSLQGRRVPAGTTLWLATRHMLRHDPEVQAKLGSDLQSYRPSRWFASPNSLVRHPPFDTLPYGHPPRTCVAMPLANYQATLVLARVLHSFKLHWYKAPLKEISHGLTSNDFDAPVVIQLQGRSKRHARSASSLSELHSF